MTTAATFPSDRELVLERVLNAPREKLYRCWTTPELIVQWFTPPPFKTTKAVMDVCAGGTSCVTMQSPEGQEFPNPGVFESEDGGYEGLLRRFPCTDKRIGENQLLVGHDLEEKARIGNLVPVR